MINRQPQALWKFFIIFLGAMFVLYQFLLQGSTSLMIPQLKEDLCIDMTYIGFLSAGFFYPYVLLQMPAGALADRFGPRNVLIVSTGLLALGTFFFAISNTMWTAEASRIFMGTASAPGVACAMCLGARWYPDKFALIAGVLEMMGMLGGALGDVVLAASIDAFGASRTMLLCAIAGAILCVLMVIFVRNGPQHHTATQSDKQDTFPDPPMHAARLLLNIRIWQCCLFGAFMFGLISAFATLWAIPFLKVLYPNQGNWAAHGAALVFAGAAIGAVSSGYLVSRSGRMRLVMSAYALLGLVSFSLVLYLPVGKTGMMALLLLCGIAAGSYILAFDSVKQLVPETMQGSAMGMTNMIAMLIGAPVMQPVIGWLLQSLQQSDSAGICVSSTLQAYQYALLPLLGGLILALIAALNAKNHP